MAKYRYSKRSSPFDDDKKMYIIIGICALAVIAALILCLVLQGNSGGSGDIPVVEQGDNSEPMPGYDGVTSMGDIIVDDGGAPVEEFTVAVSGADGLYQRDEASSLTISGQSAESFSFELAVPEGTVSGTAYFTAERSAVCEKASGAISFAFDAGAVYLTTDGAIEELGQAKAEGLFALVQAAPTTTVSGSDVTTTTTAATTTQAAGGKYDLDVIKSDAVKSALSGVMSQADYTLMNDLLSASGGYGIIYGTGESSKEKQGRAFNYDSQMDAVMYYSFESGTGREVVVLCAARAKVYAGVCDGSEYRYYTNDSARKSAEDAPNYIRQYAGIKGMTLKGQ